MRGLAVFVFILLICADRVAVAQKAEIETLQLSDSGLAYLKAVRFRGIDTDVGYFDPTRPAPTLETDAALELGEESRDGAMTLSSDGQWNVAITALLVILFLVILVLLNRVGLSVSFRKEAKNARRRTIGGAEEQKERLPPDLDAILRQSDRQKALVRLSQFVLTHCLKANGVLLQRSWTQREALRKLPKTLPNLSDLQALVLDSERVSFGGRKVSDNEFQAHVSRISPFLQGMAQ